jgi:uncharacterized membrane protein YfcA
VASNLCHKFPKALVGAYQRNKFGHVDVKLGLVMAASAAIGVWLGADIQYQIKEHYGEPGSNLYVSLAFVIVLTIVGGFVLHDAVTVYRSGQSHEQERVSRLARWAQSVEIPGTMMHFRTANVRVSVLFTLPLGFATGLLASIIAVGGFIGVPGMMYVLGAPGLVATATELVIAFVMGCGGTIKYALHGLVDIRLALILLAGSLFGIQLGVIGTTYVKPFMIKVVMAAIMLIVAVSRGLVVPVYLTELGQVDLAPRTMAWLQMASFAFLVLRCARAASSSSPPCSAASARKLFRSRRRLRTKRAVRRHRSVMPVSRARHWAGRRDTLGICGLGTSGRCRNRACGKSPRPGGS